MSNDQIEHIFQLLLRWYFTLKLVIRVLVIFTTSLLAICFDLDLVQAVTYPFDNFAKRTNIMLCVVVGLTLVFIISFIIRSRRIRHLIWYWS